VPRSKKCQKNEDLSLNTTPANSKIVLVLVLNEMVLVLLLGAPSGFEYEHESIVMVLEQPLSMDTQEFCLTCLRALLVWRLLGDRLWYRD
jgi:hypothetical protein